MFGDAVTMLTDIDPDIMLYVFLPPLIFGEAMSLNWHHVQGVLGSHCVLV
jgi:NhaP-type Na+/H+ or K+/H+ antiporter